MNSHKEHPLVKEQKADRFLTPGEVAKIFRVDPKTVSRWAQAGKIPSVFTPGGHRRYRLSDVTRVLEVNTPE